MKKSICIVCIIALFAVSLTGCEFFDNIFNKNKEEATSTAEQIETKAPETEPQTEEPFEYSTDPSDYVGVAREAGYGDGYTIPEIKLDSRDARTANADINGLYGPIFDIGDEVDSSYYCTSISYDAYVANEMLSVVVTAEYNGSTDYYSVYTFDLRDNSLMSNNDIIEKLDMNKDEVNEKLKKAAEAAFKDKFEESFADDVDYEDCFEKTMSEDNLKDAKLYIGEEGALKALVPMNFVTDLRYHGVLVTL